jgi:hypothetical protein
VDAEAYVMFALGRLIVSKLIRLSRHIQGLVNRLHLLWIVQDLVLIFLECLCKG